jgi:ankyrin repeat protein
VVKYLAKKQGADVKARDKYDTTPLHDACINRNLDVVKYLVEQGANVRNEIFYLSIRIELRKNKKTLLKQYHINYNLIYMIYYYFFIVIPLLDL